MNATLASAATPYAARSSSRAIGIWLALCCAMIFVMVVLGGTTRLTQSGLSMVEWHPVTGWLPPLTDAAWQAAFDEYKRSPEFHKANFWMQLADYKSIFWLEYVHRLWGRLIGVAFLVPFLWFAARRRIDAALGWRFALLFALGACQGALGWVMVASGLVDRPSVSHYRLAAHLGLAVIIYGWMLWIAFGILRPSPSGARAAGTRVRGPLAGHARLLAGWVFATMIVGAFVAGLHAGTIYNTFPLMDGDVLPPVAFQMTPWWINFFDNAALVQFIHRMVGVTAALIALALWLRSVRAPIAPGARLACLLVGLGALAQMGLGIATLLTQVPVPLGVLHQAGALTVLSLALWALYQLGLPPDRTKYA
jgi:cytochrome c oxidase assembly protein subunit 15